MKIKEELRRNSWVFAVKLRKFLLIPIFALGASVITFTYTDVLNMQKEIRDAKATVELKNAIEDYYSNVNGTGASLLASVKTTVNKGYHSMGYDGLIDVYNIADVRQDGYYFDLYSNTTKFAIGKNKCGNYSNPGDCWNKEHTIPQSWWGEGTSNQGCDAYIVLLSDGKINGMRSNYPYGETSNGDIWKYGNDYEVNRLGNSTSTQYLSSGTKCFEPMDSRKGDLARVYFYAMAKWNAQTFTKGNGYMVFGTGSDTTNGIKTNYLQMLLKWHTEDPVDDREIARNNAVQTLQKNRNPFVDHPSWVDLIWGGIYDPNAKNAEDSDDGKAVVEDGKLQPAVVRNLESISVSNPKTQYTYGDTFVKPTVIAHYDNGDTKDVSTKATFSGQNMYLVANQTVTVKYSESGTNVSTTYSINVKDKEKVPVQSINLSIAKNKFYEQATSQLSYTTTPSSIYPGLESVIYTSDNEEIATVSSTGLVTGKKEGTTTIRVSAMQNADTTINVDDSVEVTIEKRPIDPKSFTITRSVTSGSGSYAWQTWTTGGATGELYYYSGETSNMQFNRNKGTPKVETPTVYNTVALTGPINSITMKTKKLEGLWEVFVADTVITRGSNANKVSLGQKNVTSSGVTWLIDSGVYSFFSLEYMGGSACYMDAFTINYGNVVDELESIQVVNPVTEYHVGESFVAPIVNAIYTQSNPRAVAATFSGYNMSMSGDQTVTVRYTENSKTVTATYQIRVIQNEAPVTPSNTSSSKGCGGSIIATSVVLSALAILGVGIILVKKRKYSQK